MEKFSTRIQFLFSLGANIHSHILMGFFLLSSIPCVVGL